MRCESEFSVLHIYVCLSQRSSKEDLASWHTAVIPATQEAKIGRVMVQGQLGQKIIEIPSQPVKLGMVTCACLTSYVGVVNRTITVQAGLGKNTRSYQKNNYSKKGWGHGSCGILPAQQYISAIPEFKSQCHNK